MNLHRALRLSLLLSSTLAPSLAPAAELSNWWDTHGSYSIKNLSSVLHQQYSRIDLNENNLLDIPEYTLLNEFRPEASLNFEQAYFQIKPRFVSKREYFRSGARYGEEQSDSDFYINEWLAQFFLSSELSVSYGREDLQWGPAFLLSPSNPFDSKNGRTEPKTEVSGADYAKITWTPDSHWTLTGIINTDDGRKNYRVRDELRQDFRDIYALKIDYLFDRGYAGLVLSTVDHGTDQDDRAAYYISYNLSDALIAYSEGSISEEDEEFLIGNTYTFSSGLSLSTEYFYNSTGLLDSIPSDPIDLVDLEDELLDFPNRESFIRKNYILIQAYQNDIYRSLDLLLRYTYNLDDNSRSLLGHMEFDLSDNLSFFTSATLNSSRQGEFDSKREHWIQAGIELSF